MYPNWCSTANDDGNYWTAAAATATNLSCANLQDPAAASAAAAFYHHHRLPPAVPSNGHGHKGPQAQPGPPAAYAHPSYDPSLPPAVQMQPAPPSSGNFLGSYMKVAEWPPRAAGLDWLSAAAVADPTGATSFMGHHGYPGPATAHLAVGVGQLPNQPGISDQKPPNLGLYPWMRLTGQSNTNLVLLWEMYDLWLLFIWRFTGGKCKFSEQV